MRIFVVGRGDSLRSISSRFSVSADTLARVNELEVPNRLSIGQALVIPEAEHPDTEIEVNGYAYPSIGGDALAAALPSLTWLCPFSYTARSDGSLAPVDDTRLITAAYDHSVAPLLTVANIGDGGGFSSDIAHSLLTDEAVRERFVESTMRILHEKGYCGVNLFFQYIYPYDRVAYNGLLCILSERLHSEGFYLCSAIAPKTDDDRHSLLCFAHDYAAHGKYCDRVVIMTYDHSHAYSAPGAVSPVDRMRKVLQYAITQIEPGKILLGFSNYGYNRSLPQKQGEAAQLISNAAATALAASVFAEIKFDDAAAAPYFNYTDPSGVKHEVWFEDARSVRARLELVVEFSLAGISYWTLRGLGQSGLYLLNSMFNTEKMR